MKLPSYNQTQFSAEDPLVHGKIELPPKEVSPEELAEQRALLKEKRKKLMMVAGSLLVVISLIVMIAMMWQPKQSVAPDIIDEEEITPTPKEMTLREEIDQLMLEVDKSNRASRTLVFPPVESEFRVELP